MDFFNLGVNCPFMYSAGTVLKLVEEFGGWLIIYMIYKK